MKFNKIGRPLLYATTLVVGMSAAFDQLEGGYARNFFTLIFIVSLILLIEIYTSWSFHKSRGDQLQIRLHTKREEQLHWIHHVILPALTFYTSAGYIYFNHDRSLRWILYLLTIFVFTVLFYNLRSYFEHDLLGVTATNYIYDILKLYLIFLTSNVLLQALSGLPQLIIVPVLIGGIAGLFTALSTGRKRLLTRRSLVSSIVIGILLGSALLFMLISTTLNPQAIALIALMIFYFANALLHHYLEKTLSSGIIVEYLVVIFLVINILRSLS